MYTGERSQICAVFDRLIIGSGREAAGCGCGVNRPISNSGTCWISVALQNSHMSISPRPYFLDIMTYGVGDSGNTQSIECVEKAEMQGIDIFNAVYNRPGSAAHAGVHIQPELFCLFGVIPKRFRLIEWYRKKVILLMSKMLMGI
jgi:hypothetical protein